MNNREIKFRVWDKEFNKWASVRNFLLDRVWDIKLYSIPYEDYERFVFQQFTGLRDSKDVEIYEGDIMASRGNYITDEVDEDGNYPDLHNVVVWNVKNSRFALKPIKEYLNNLKNPPRPDLDNPWTCYLTTFKEVIGNIFENPELLK